jgi:dihydroorotate dehydrogenase (fumarate)
LLPIRQLGCLCPEIEEAGADAIELNVSTHLPDDDSWNARDFEKNICDVVADVKRQVSIPVSVKIGPYFTNLIAIARGLEKAGADSLVIFNRYYRPDIDIEQLEVTSENYLSSPGELSQSLRWVGVLSQQVQCHLAANTGVHDYEAVVKQLLAGATVTQFCSVLYVQGLAYITTMLEDLKWWMKQKRFSSVGDFRGKMVDDRLNSAQFEQVHFVRKNVRMFD